ncbi:MAG: RsmD family RNA methyltransferase, partial [Proteobacteria bacterium]|nr:RsmD family RNA methyltransferase [Pseudomonadota bacterium]
RGRTRVLVEDGLTGYRRATSDRQIPVSDCPILMPQVNAALGALNASQPVDGEWELALGEPDSTHPDGVRVLPLIAGHEAGPPLDITVGPDTVHIAPGGFAQTNPLLFDTLIDSVCEATGQGARLLELYAGSGFFTLPLARRFTKVMAVESNAKAISFLNSSARDAGLRGIEACAEDVETFVLSARCTQFLAGVVFVDPPRAGLGVEVVRALSKPGPKRLVYLSCDAATLARDVAGLTQAEWKLMSVTGYDLFPQTPHVEGLVVLER